MKHANKALLIATAVISFHGIAHAENINSTSPQTESSTLSTISPAAGDVKNMSRSDIRMIQDALNKSGYTSGNADGVLGARTEAALRSFQQDKNISVTGTVTAETMTHLGIADARMKATSSSNGSELPKQDHKNHQPETDEESSPANGNSSQYDNDYQTINP